VYLTLVAAGIQLQIIDEAQAPSSLKHCHTEKLGSTSPETLGFGAGVHEKVCMQHKVHNLQCPQCNM